MSKIMITDDLYTEGALTPRKKRLLKYYYWQMHQPVWSRRRRAPFWLWRILYALRIWRFPKTEGHGRNFISRYWQAEDPLK